MWAWLAASALVAQAEVYKSVDADGNVVFSQSAPIGQASEVVTPKVAAPPSQTPASAAARYGQNSKLYPAVTRELSPQQLENKRKNCATARAQLAQAQDPHVYRMQYKNEQGELAFLTPEMIQQRVDAAQGAIKQYCE
jgi:hypothetical protein